MVLQAMARVGKSLKSVQMGKERFDGVLRVEQTRFHAKASESRDSCFLATSNAGSSVKTIEAAGLCHKISRRLEFIPPKKDENKANVPSVQARKITAEIKPVPDGGETNMNGQGKISLIKKVTPLLLDVRSVFEVERTGYILGAYFLPIEDLYYAFQTFTERFEKKYGFSKPEKHHEIICYCLFGARSQTAVSILTYLGYHRVIHYRGGIREFSQVYPHLIERLPLASKEDK